MFKRHWFHKTKTVPAEERVHRVRRWDLAATTEKEGKDPDYTVGLLMARTGRGTTARYYIEDVVRFRGSPLEVRRSIKATGIGDTKTVKIVIPQDPGQAGKGQAQDIVAGMSGWNIRKELEARGGDKAQRAEPFAAQLEAGNVFLIEGDWNEEFIEELCAFPRGHDDQVDAAAGAFNALLHKGDGLEGVDLSLGLGSRDNPYRAT